MFALCAMRSALCELLIMTGTNGHRYRSSSNMLIASVDAFLILLSILMAAYLRFWGSGHYVIEVEHLIWKMFLIVLVIELAFYYFDLYDSRLYREKKATGILVLESLGASSIFLAVIYYLVPLLTIGRGIFAISLVLIFMFTFSWRLLFNWASKARTFKERVLIVGTGELAKRIRRELLENGHDGFEIVGFIDESRDKIGKRV